LCLTGKKQVVGSVAVDQEDVDTFKKLQDLDVELEIRRAPSERSEQLSKMLDEFE